MKSSTASAILKTLGLTLLIAGHGSLQASPKPGQPWQDLIERSQFVLEARPIKASAGIVTITFRDPTAEIPPLERKAYKFIRLGVMKNFLNSDLPDTLTVFEGNTASAIHAHRALHASGETEIPDNRIHRSRIKAGTLARQKTVILFLNQIVDDTLVQPNNRFELTAGQSYEPGSMKKEIMKLLPRKETGAAPIE